MNNTISKMFFEDTSLKLPIYMIVYTIWGIEVVNPSIILETLKWQ